MLDLDVEAFRAYRSGDSTELPTPFCDDPADVLMMSNVNGQKVLCLAGGGGQQSAVYSLLGADVTVVDVSPDQIASDELAAEHYGYSVTAIQGDMRDLSSLQSSYFCRVYQPISTLFVPDLSEVFSGVARVLQTGGLYYVDFAFPFIYLAEDRGWDGEGYLLHISEQYARGAIFESETGKMSLTKGQSFAEFHHLFSDVVNGLIKHGLSICGLWENPRPGAAEDFGDIVPGTQQHRERCIPYGFSVVAENR